MAIVAEVRVLSSRRAEAFLLALAAVLVVGAYVLVGLGASDQMPADVWLYAAGTVTLALAGHLALRKWAPSADPVLFPAAFALNGLGLAMILRLDIAREGTARATDFATRQLGWSLLAVVVAIGVVVALRDHRLLRRFTFTALVAALGLLVVPMLPFIGHERRGARIWIELFGYTFQPAEVAKIALAVFFAGYLAANRDTIVLAGKRVLGMRLPRLRDLAPIAIVWVASLAVLAWQRDLGTSLLFFGLFVAMLYVATERLEWVVLGIAMFMGGALVAGIAFPHVGRRYDAWLHALDPEVYASGTSEQLVRGLFGFANGGLFGTGLGRGRPEVVPFAESDFIVASIGEELGLVGLLAVLTLYLIIVERALRTAIGVSDSFGKLLAAGLGFTMALQIFVVVGGVTRLIPLTGLTTPFLAYGGSSLLANWIVVALLLRISDGARRPLEDRR